MSKRNRDRSGVLGSAGSGRGSLSDIQEMDRQIFGEVLEIDENRKIAEPVSIFEIRPDRAQPRRILPSEIRRNWDGQPLTLADTLSQWHEQVETLRDTPLDLVAFLSGTGPESDLSTDEGEIPGSVNALEAAYMEIVQLAATIKRDGLTNPITIVRQGPDYIIETGERRWLAYHLLYAVFGDKVWESIPAVEVKVSSVWRQANENNARNNLNAIAKARQFALLLMDLYGQDHFQPYEGFADDQAFYAQVADGEAYPTPRGHGDQLLAAMGFRDKAQYRRHRDLLRLPPQVWDWADTLSWTEGFIRKLKGRARDDAELTQLAAIEARKSGLSVPNGTLKPSASADSGDSAPQWQRTLERTFSPQKWRRMSAEEQQDALEYVRALVLQLETMMENQPGTNNLK